MQVNMLEAKTQLSRLVEAALNGEEVVIANRGKPVVKMVPVAPAKRAKPGSCAGWLTSEELDAAFSPEVEAEIAAMFNGPIEPRERVAKTQARARKGKPAERMA
jgi:prevent-host-death family protein